jgi:pimeloyl-ACP methyl ester carboxylesterase
MTEKVTSADGTVIAYDRYGDGGPPVIYVGGAYNDRGAGRGVGEVLADRFTVYSYDRRGRGDSGDTPPYAVEREIEDLAALVAVAGGEAAACSMSSGGALLLAAAASGVPLSRLALYEPPFTPDVEERRAGAREYGDRLAEALAAGRRDTAVELFLGIVGTPAEMIAQLRGAPMWPALEALAPSLAYDAAVMRNRDGATIPTDRLPAVTVPTLVIAGGASPAWLRDIARQLADALPDGHHTVLPDQTHDVDPAALATALAGFLIS